MLSAIEIDFYYVGVDSLEYWWDKIHSLNFLMSEYYWEIRALSFDFLYLNFCNVIALFEFDKNLEHLYRKYGTFVIGRILSFS